MSTHTIRLGFTRPPLTSNDQRRAHWTKIWVSKAQVHEDVHWRVKAARIVVTPPVEVFVTWYAPDARIRDSDALGPFLKAVLDGLVNAGVIPGDDFRYVPRSGSSVVVDRADPRIELSIVETEQPEGVA